MIKLGTCIMYIAATAVLLCAIYLGRVRKKNRYDDWLDLQEDIYETVMETLDLQSSLNEYDGSAEEKCERLNTVVTRTVQVQEKITQLLMLEVGAGEENRK